jgi:hypothetical protein
LHFISSPSSTLTVFAANTNALPGAPSNTFTPISGGAETFGVQAQSLTSVKRGSVECLPRHLQFFYQEPQAALSIKKNLKEVKQFVDDLGLAPAEASIAKHKLENGARCFRRARHVLHDVFDRSDFCDNSQHDYQKHITEMYNDFDLSAESRHAWQDELNEQRKECCKKGNNHKAQKQCIRKFLGDDLAKAIGR